VVELKENDPAPWWVWISVGLFIGFIFGVMWGFSNAAELGRHAL